MGKDAAVILAGRFLQALLSIAALRVMTALLSPAEVGNIFLLLSFVTGFSFFLVSPVGMYINRRLHAWHDARTILSRFAVFNVYLLFVSAAAVLATIAVKKVLGIGPGLPALPFALLVAAYLYCNTWNMTLIPALNMLGFRVPFVAFSILTTGAGLGLSLLASVKISPTAFSWLSGQVSAMLLLSAAALYSLRNNIGETFKGAGVKLAGLNGRTVSTVADFAVPLAGAMVFMWLQNQGYRLIVEMRAGAAFLGYLAVGLGIAASLAAVAETLVQQIYSPLFYKRISTAGPAERKKALEQFSGKTLPVYLILLVFTVSLSAPLTVLLVDPKFHDAARFVVFGAFVEFFRMAANIVSSAAHSEMHTRLLLLPYAAGGITTCAGVLAASTSYYKDNLIPAAMVLGGLVTLLAMRRETARVIPFSLNRRLMARTAAYAAPFLVFLLLKNFTSTVGAAALLAAAGAYFLLLQYLVAFKWTEAGTAPGWQNMRADVPAQPGGNEG